MDWIEAASKYHEQAFAHDSQLDCLQHDWQRELAAFWRLEADVNNGGYLQFIQNWGHESYVYASQALRRMGAKRAARLVDQCQAIVDEHCNTVGTQADEIETLAPYQAIMGDGSMVSGTGVLPEFAISRIMELSYEYMNCEEDLWRLERHAMGSISLMTEASTERMNVSRHPITSARLLLRISTTIAL